VLIVECIGFYIISSFSFDNSINNRLWNFMQPTIKPMTGRNISWEDYIIFIKWFCIFSLCDEDLNILFESTNFTFE